ncbi:hypothetical protein [Uliginosibacterium gangwonense]|uniref:hypothetical protein n=1 Tax=Uliginosibacterium gangwonense TaxID=392736 RepID=UPI00039A0DED|nr:hypothetical protein [Uliginosibacterium gangwonense]
MWNLDTWMYNSASVPPCFFHNDLYSLVGDELGMTTMEYALLASLLAMLIIIGLALNW